jgi:hypothetical protein
VCSLVNIKLAEDCLNNDKAFSVQTEGVVLGVRFNTKTQQWSLPKPKADELIRKLLWAAQAEELSLNQTQQVLGSLNDLAQMCPFMKPYKALANKFLASFNDNGNVLLPMSDIVKADLMVCARIAETARCGLPIPAQPSLPPLTAFTCYSDAAGCKFTIAKGVRHCHNVPDDRGVACVLLDKEGKVIGWSRVFWPKTFLEEAKDEKGAFNGSKTATLEAIGLLLPFLTKPESLKGKHVVFRIDNMAVVYGWENKQIKNDTAATIVLRAVNLLAAYLGVHVHVQHIPRCSNTLSTLADHLSRKSSTTTEDMNMLADVPESEVNGSLVHWLSNPVLDWNLPRKLLREIKNGT